MQELNIPGISSFEIPYPLDHKRNIPASKYSASSLPCGMPLFGKKKPAEIVGALAEALEKVATLEKGDKKSEKAKEDVAKRLTSLKNLMVKTETPDENSTTLLAIAKEASSSGLLKLLIKNLAKLDFNSKRDACSVIANILRAKNESGHPAVDQLSKNQSLLTELIRGYEDRETALVCGKILRECAQYEGLAQVIIESKEFYNLFGLAEMSDFNKAADAFLTLQELLRKHKRLCAEFLDQNYETFFKHYQKLINCENYGTRRQSLEFLVVLLTEPQNSVVINKYISNTDNLKLIMNVLRDESRNIQIEAFQVLRVFVANQNKPEPISNLLLQNQEKLIDLLNSLRMETTSAREQEQFDSEKAILIEQIQNLRPSEQQ